MLRNLMVGRTMACDDFRRLQLTRRATLRAGLLSLTGLGLPRLLQRGRGVKALAPAGLGEQSRAS